MGVKGRGGEGSVGPTPACCAATASRASAARASPFFLALPTASLKRKQGKNTCMHIYLRMCIVYVCVWDRRE